MTDRFATLRFRRVVDAPVTTLWQVWTAPAARALWAPPTPDVTVEIVEAGTTVGAREVSICKVAGQPDIRVEGGWLHLSEAARSIGYEVVSSGGVDQSAALVTADFSAEVAGRDGAAPPGSAIEVTVQLSSLARDMTEGYQQGFGAGLDNLAAVAARKMLITRTIRAPRHLVWGAWVNADALPRWWGPEGFSCRTERIDLRAGGEWVFDMIGPDGTVYPNHHRYGEMHAPERLGYTLLWGENGPKHADAWAAFDAVEGGTRVTLGLVFATGEEFRAARGFGAEALGLETLGKLAQFIGAA